MGGVCNGRSSGQTDSRPRCYRLRHGRPRPTARELRLSLLQATGLAQGYVVENLQISAFGTRAFDVNDAGRVVGIQQHALLWPGAGVGDLTLAEASPEETARLVAAFLAEHPEWTAADAGRATGLFMTQHAGSVDPGAASAGIREGLAKRPTTP